MGKIVADESGRGRRKQLLVRSSVFSRALICVLCILLHMRWALCGGVGGVGGSDHDGALLMPPSIPGNSGHVSLREG